MKIYDFDHIVDRRTTGAVKVDALKQVFGKSELIPLWVADMDFETPDFIIDAMRKRLEHPVFGYTVEPAELWPTVQDWIYTHHQWKTSPEMFAFIPGIVKGIGMAINALLEKDEKVIIQPPVYHPFRIVPQENGRQIVYNPLIHNADGSYSMDFEHLESISDPKCKMLILSNPHNPAGIVWDRESLIKLARICHSKGITVISDEIHCDMALFGNKHIPFASTCPEAAACSITFQAPSKTFNIAGIVSSYAVVPDETLRNRFFSYLKANEFSSPDIFAPIATIAAYKEGDDWRKQMLSYIEGNIFAVEKFCAENIPQILPLRPQASFLVWLDCRALGLGHDQLVSLFTDKASLALNDGEMFGKEAAGYMRMNVACPRPLLLKALAQLASAVHNLTC